MRIAIFDSGSTAHPDLAGRFTGGRDFVDGNGPVDEGMWHHGTHVAGIVGALTNTSPAIGGAGICPGCTMIPIRLATPAGGLDLTQYGNALHWAAGDLDGGVRQADIVTLSMNLDDSSACPNDVATAVAYANAHGVVVINSAGNYGTSPHQPANCAGIISVAATQQDKSLATYSDRGPVTLAAPGGAGELGANGTAGGGFGPGIGCPAGIDTTLGIDPGTDGILSSWAVYPIVSPTAADYCYRYLSGTSMAAPHVAGTVGLMLSALPTNMTFTPAQVTKLLTLTAEPLACTGTACGAGLLDARAAVTAASQGGLPRLSTTTTALAFGPVSANTASADQVATVNDIGVGPATVTSIVLTGTGASQFQIDRPGCGQSCSGPLAVAEDGSLAIPVRCQPTAAGTPTANLVFHSNSDTGDLTIPLSCTATAPQIRTGSLTAVAFGNVQVSSAALGSAVLTSTGNTPITVTAIDIADANDFELAFASGACAGAAHCTLSQAVATTFTIPVRCHPKARGAISSQITVTTDGAPAQLTGQLTCTGITPHVVLGGASLAFGAVAIGATASADVSVANTTAGTQLSFSVSQGSGQYALSCVSGCTCADDICSGFVGTTPADVRVTFAPTQIGAQPANVTFITNDPDAPTTTLAATGTGTGPVFQRVAPTSGELDFLSASGQTSAPQTVEIANAGNAPLHITAAPVSGAAASAVQVSAQGGLPVTIAPGANANFSVTCTPNWVGAGRSAQLTFTADAGLTTTIIDVTCNTNAVILPPNPTPNPDPPPPVTQ